MSRVPIFKKCRFEVGWGFAPHPKKVWKGGEDALFVSKTVLVIVDGVGEWIKMGVDSGQYARGLIANIRKLVQNDLNYQYHTNPRKLAQDAVKQTQQKGSATLTILTLDPRSGNVHTYHVGDSVFAHCRPDKAPIVAKDMQKQFNVPFQVSAAEGSDDEDADVHLGIVDFILEKDAKEGYFVVASDGLWDNLFIEDIQRELLLPSEVQGKARQLIQNVKEKIALKEYQSPFYLKAKEHGKEIKKKAKIDDISIIVAKIVFNS